MRHVPVLLFAAVLLAGIAWMRPAEYDEAYSIFLTAGHARPVWPRGVFHPSEIRALYQGAPGPWQIAHDLRVGDVHPPLYFWALDYWRRVVGPSWFAARLFSVALTVGALAVLARLAALVKAPVAPALFLALFAYGFAYTGMVARGFALAQLLNLCGVALAVAAVGRRPRFGWAFGAGLALGAAGFSNYLACFIGCAVLLWLLASHLRLFLPALLGFVLFIPADAYFFLAQRASRLGQFVPFSWGNSLPLLARDEGAAWFGGLPVLAGRFAPVLVLALGVLAVLCAVFAVRRRGKLSGLFLLASLAMPIGLLALGLIFDNTPIEIRYLAFSLPFLALLCAGLPRWLLLLLLTVECAGCATLLVPATQQNQVLAARQAVLLAPPDALVLLPFGNDGVGVPGPFLQAVPDDLRILLVRPNDMINLNSEERILLPAVGADDASRRTIAMLQAGLTKDRCWRPQNTVAQADMTQKNAVYVEIFSRICKRALPLN